MSGHIYRIAIRKDGHIIKLAQVGFYNNEEGCFVSVPYFHDKVGHLTKLPIDYSTSRSSYIKRTIDYTASSEVKLSLHEDGFTQFSGKGLVSGLDSDGNPKGLGIFRNPINTIIKSGPFVVVQFWGLYKFPKLNKTKKTIILDIDDAIYSKKFDDKKYQRRSYVLNIFQIEAKHKDRIFNVNGVLHYNHTIKYQGCYKNLKLRIIPVLDRDYFLGLSLEKNYIEFNCENGYILCSPSEASTISIKSSLFAMYPKNVIGDQFNSISLDYK